MNTRFILTLCVVALAGCGGSQPPIGASGAMLQSRAVAQPHKNPNGGNDLLYVSNEKTDILVYDWPSGKPFEKIDRPSINLCADSRGNVWVVDETLTLYEYAHGGKRVIDTLQVPGAGGALACSVDPSTGNLAVVAIICGGSCRDAIAVFPNAQGTPTLYPSNIGLTGIGYDNSGNLFVDGYGGLSIGWTMAELPQGGSTFNTLRINDDLLNLGSIQWDGQYLSVEGNEGDAGRLPVIYQMQVSGNDATIVNTVAFGGVAGTTGLSSWSQGDSIAIPFRKAHNKGFEIGIWRYPNGGKIRKVIDTFRSHKFGPVTLSAVTVSLAPR